MNREQIYSALFARLQTVAGFTTIERRLKHWTDTPAEQQPALFMTQKSESASTQSGAPTKWTLHLDLYLYARADSGQAPGPILNPLLDAVCNVINELHPVTGRNSLGLSSVAFCRVDGQIETDEGTLGDQAVCIVPVTILAA